MNILTLTDEIKHKLNHSISTKLNPYLKSIENEPESERESKVSMFVTDLTFQLSSKIVKEKMSKINPKPFKFTLKINREKYFEQTANELMSQVNDTVYFDKDIIQEQKEQFRGQGTFDMEFSGYFLEDQGYIGTKNIIQKEEMLNQWFPAILSCLKVQENEYNPTDIVSFVKNFVTFGFAKALDLDYVFIESHKMNDTLTSVDSAIVDNKEIGIEDFIKLKVQHTFGKNK